MTLILVQIRILLSKELMGKVLRTSKLRSISELEKGIFFRLNFTVNCIHDHIPVDTFLEKDFFDRQIRIKEQLLKETHHNLNKG